MGKAHTCVLTKNGEVWTFGVNNKGQCGRDTGAMSQAGKGEHTHRTNTHYTLYCIFPFGIHHFHATHNLVQLFYCFYLYFLQHLG